MHRLLLCLILLLPAPHLYAQEARGRAGDEEAAADYAAALTELLQQVVTDDGRVRYDLLRGPLRPAFRRVLKAVEAYDAAALDTQAERLAFWLNAYNVQMLQHIVETPAVRDILADGYTDRFFKTPLRTARTAVTLDQIEHVILRRQDGPPALERLQVSHLDPRIHVGLNCAAVSCPRLRSQAFTPGRVDAMLEAAMRDFVNSPRHLRVDGDRVVLSALLDWFGTDFEAGGMPAGDVLLRYMDPGRPDAQRLAALLEGRTAAQLKAHPAVHFAYDWAVNRAVP